MFELGKERYKKKKLQVKKKERKRVKQRGEEMNRKETMDCVEKKNDECGVSVNFEMNKNEGGKYS